MKHAEKRKKKKSVPRIYECARVCTCIDLEIMVVILVQERRICNRLAN